eukprot:Pgem_evm1s5485
MITHINPLYKFKIQYNNNHNTESEGLLAMWYRSAQAFDYESSISAFQGAFSLCGMLPVIPGPCGMYRMSDISGPCLDYYMDFINNTTAENGIMQGNLLLAEDRILSYAAALKTGKYTRWVPSAIFYFEAETESEKFLAQRRRWTNGTFACYIYLLFMVPGLIFRAPKHNIFFKIVIYSQILIQCLLYIISAAAPAVFITLCYYSVLQVNFAGALSQWLAYGVLGIYGVLYITFCFGHYFYKFIHSMYNIILGWNTVMFFFVLAMTLTTFINQSTLVIAVMCMSMFFPFALALLHSLDVFFMMMFNFLPFFLFLPTFVPWFMAYSLSRTWDLSWGNRPSDADVSEIKAKKNLKTSLKIKSFVFLAFIVLLNCGIIASFVLFIDNVTTLVYVSTAIISISIMQQILSFFYYLFCADHTMSSFFENFKKSHLKVLSTVLYCITLGLLLGGVFTTHWLTTTLEVHVPRYTETVLNVTETIWQDGNNESPKPIIITPYNATTTPEQIYRLTTKTSFTSISIYNLPLNSVDIANTFGNSFVQQGYTASEYYYNETIQTLTLETKSVVGSEVKQEKITPFASYTLNITIGVCLGNGVCNSKNKVLRIPAKNNYKTQAIPGQLPLLYNHSITNYTAALFEKRHEGEVKVNYGLLFLEYQYHGPKFTSEVVLWGSNVLWDTPNKTWSFAVILTLSASFMFILNLVSLFYSFISPSKSRTYSVTVIYSWIGCTALLAGVLLFPFSFESLTAYQIGWWEALIPSEINRDAIRANGTAAMKEMLKTTNENGSPMCGPDTSYFNPGECAIGFSYILVIVSLLTGLLSYNLLRFALSKIYISNLNDDKAATVFKKKAQDDDEEPVSFFKMWTTNSKKAGDLHKRDSQMSLNTFDCDISLSTDTESICDLDSAFQNSVDIEDDIA